MEIYNDDYKKGMKLLITECKKNYIDYHKLRWLIKFNKMLSKNNICYKFWNNVVSQGRLKRIEICQSVENMVYGEETCLFAWGCTKEGSDFWFKSLYKVFNGFHGCFFLNFNSKLWEI